MLVLQLNAVSKRFPGDPWVMKLDLKTSVIYKELYKMIKFVNMMKSVVCARWRGNFSSGIRYFVMIYLLTLFDLNPNMDR